LTQFKTKVQPSFDARTQISTLEDQLTSAQDKRDATDKTTVATNQPVVNAVKGDPNYGDDSDLYDAMGYVRRSAGERIDPQRQGEACGEINPDEQRKGGQQKLSALFL
jgi:hypothetical protein